MDFDWTEEQLMFKQAIRDFTEKEIAPLVDEAEEKEEFPVELFPKMGKLGYLAVGYPAEYDGGGMGSIGECILQEEVARVNCGIASALNAQIALGTHIIYDHGIQHQYSIINFTQNICHQGSYRTLANTAFTTYGNFLNDALPLCV